jgi:hypothetical protein
MILNRREQRERRARRKLQFNRGECTTGKGSRGWEKQDGEEV